jgi:hypothetical protein
MQKIVGLIIIIGMMWGAIKLVVALPYGLAILFLLVLLWAACLK